MFFLEYSECSRGFVSKSLFMFSKGFVSMSLFMSKVSDRFCPDIFGTSSILMDGAFLFLTNIARCCGAVIVFSAKVGEN